MKYQVEGLCCVVRSDCYYVGFKTDLDHIKTRGAGGGDNKDNLIPLCRKHHTERHAIGLSKMAQKYPRFKRKLEQKGWSLTSGKWNRIK